MGYKIAFVQASLRLRKRRFFLTEYFEGSGLPKLPLREASLKGNDYMGWLM